MEMRAPSQKYLEIYRLKRTLVRTEYAVAYVENRGRICQKERTLPKD